MRKLIFLLLIRIITIIRFNSVIAGGIISSGDRLTPSNNGLSRALPNTKSGAVIGTALESLGNGRWNMIAQNYYYTAPAEINNLKSQLSQLKLAVCAINQTLDICK